ncbi:MAG: thiamine monophosphate synthase [Chromatiales bacterium 21-64-14]|nr:MAG: thiamine monophosphate synthase [Chromatiales bacterium 21-64-14]HQU14887.1 Nudix family hydrolase [Gammaproteobacteria bacterium]
MHAVPIHVAVAVIFDTRGRVLITRRPHHAHQGGLWEFPGGKVEPGESARAALGRELAEELGIEVQEARPLIRVPHDYPDRRVMLDVWRVAAFHGAPEGREGQPLDWVFPQDLGTRAFPAADRPVLVALRLPDRYLITPEPGPDLGEFLDRLEQRLALGLRLVQLRVRRLDPQDGEWLAARAVACCHRYGAQLLINGAPCAAQALGADGVHLSAARLMALIQRPLPPDQWVAASCHDASELAHAARVGVDFAVLSPVAPTPSHPGMPVLGWDGFARLTDAVPFPVYALGGVAVGDLADAFASGAQGVAAIRALWGADGPVAPPAADLNAGSAG